MDTAFEETRPPRKVLESLLTRGCFSLGMGLCVCVCMSVITSKMIIISARRLQLTLVILFTPVTLVSLFWSYNQFYRAEFITVSGFLIKQKSCKNLQFCIRIEKVLTKDGLKQTPATTKGA